MQQYSFLTASDIIDRARAEAIGSTASSLTALQDAQMIERVEEISATFVQAAHSRHSKGGWSWMRKATNFQSIQHTTLDGAILAAAADLTLASVTGLDATGRIVIETAKGALDFVDYSSIATNTLTVSIATGAETVNMGHADGEHVEKLYALPSDYSKTRVLYVNTVSYYYERSDRYPDSGRFTTYGAFLMLPRGVGAQDCTLWYEKKPATITALSSVTDIPTTYQRYAVEMLKAHIHGIRRKRQDIGTAMQLADQKLIEALDMDIQDVAQGYSTGIPLPY